MAQKDSLSLISHTSRMCRRLFSRTWQIIIIWLIGEGLNASDRISSFTLVMRLFFSATRINRRGGERKMKWERNFGGRREQREREGGGIERMKRVRKKSNSRARAGDLVRGSAGFSPRWLSAVSRQSLSRLLGAGSYTWIIIHAVHKNTETCRMQLLRGQNWELLLWIFQRTHSLLVLECFHVGSMCTSTPQQNAQKMNSKLRFRRKRYAGFINIEIFLK